MFQQSAYIAFVHFREVIPIILINKGVSGEAYNICSGTALKIEEMLKMLIGFSKADIKVEKDEARMRKADIPIMLGDYSKMKSCTGGVPMISLSQSLKDILEYWRKKVKSC